MKKAVEELSRIEKKINLDELLPSRWKKYILEEFKKQATAVQTIEEIQDLIQCWKWIANPSEWIVHALRSLYAKPAASAYFVMLDYVFNEGIDDQLLTRKEEQKYIARFRRTLHQLFSAGLITSIHLSPKELGPGKNSVSIWLAPWAKKEHIEKMKHFYLNLGGVKLPVSKERKKSPKEVAEFSHQVQVMHVMNRYKKHVNSFDYYKCPKKHVVGLKRHPKTRNRYKKEKRKFLCPDCNRQLIEIPSDDFLELIEKSLLHPTKKTI